MRAKTNPLFLECETLQFDNYSSQETKRLTPKQEGERFLAKWLDNIDPFIKYKKLFSRLSEDDINALFGVVKRMFVKYCVNNDWGEKKFVMILDNIFSNNYDRISDKLLLYNEKLYDQNRLPIQIKQQRAARRRRI